MTKLCMYTRPLFYNLYLTPFLSAQRLLMPWLRPPLSIGGERPRCTQNWRLRGREGQGQCPGARRVAERVFCALHAWLSLWQPHQWPVGDLWTWHDANQFMVRKCHVSVLHLLLLLLYERNADRISLRRRQQAAPGIVKRTLDMFQGSGKVFKNNWSVVLFLFHFVRANLGIGE